MEISVIDESTFDDPDLSIVHHGSRRKLADEFDSMVAEKKPRLDDTELADQEHMRVYLRVRPFTEKETEKQENQGCMEVENAHLLVARAPLGSNTYKNSQHGCGKQTHKFTFSKIFTQTTSQKEFFDNTLLDTVKEFIEGQNSLIFTYGVTNSGKTYTIQGHAKDGGILPRALDVLFNSIGGRQWDSMSLKPSMFCDVVKLSDGEQELEQKVKQRVLDLAVVDEESDVTVSSMVGDSDCSRLTIGSRMSEDSLNIDSGHGSEAPENSDKSAIDQLFKEAAERVREDAAVNVTTQGQLSFSVWVTFVEIYNEYIYDLLEPIPKKKTVRRPTLTLREDKHGIPYVKGVKEIQVSSADEAYKVLVIGKQNLQMACTKLNHNSSRSHCIFTIKLLRILDAENPAVARVSMLSFCDLAGAERYSKTLSAGDRIKEAGNINTSLLSLGRCIKILRHNQLNKEHQQMVPFRDSKLTRIFQSFLTGKGKASMIVNINQCASTFDETLHALKYSAIAKQVVIVQDPPKEPEQLNQPKPAVPRSSRYVSLMLAQAAANPKGPRPTIGFGTPGTLARILQEEEDEAETPKAKEDSQETVMMEIIDTLKQELVKERTEKDMLEWNIRNEVYQEMQEQLANHEREYEDRLRDMKERMEDRADSKVNLLLMSMKKKKRRRNEEEEDELNESDLLKAAIEAKDSQIQLLEEKVEEYETELKTVGKDPHHTPGTQTAPAVQTPTTQTDQMSVIEQLQDKLMDANAQLKAKEAEVAELGEMLTEAGETFEQKATEIEKLEKDLEAFRTKSSEQEVRLEELTQLLKQAEDAKADAQSQLDKADHKVKSLTAQLDAANEKDCESCQEQVVRLGEVVAKLADTEAEVDKINTDFVRLQREASQKSLEANELQEQLKAKEQEVSDLRDSMRAGEEKDSKVVQMLAQLEQLESDLGTVRDANKSYEKQILQTKDTNAELEKQVVKLQEVIDEHQGALRDHETFVAELNRQLKEAKTNLDTVTTEHAECTNKMSKINEKLQKEEEELFSAQEKLGLLEEEHDNLAVDLKAKEKKLQEDSRRSLLLESKVAALEESLQQANCSLRDTTLEAAKIKDMYEDLEKAKRALDEKHAECKPRMNDLQTQLEDYVLRVNEQAEEVGELKDKLQSEEEKVSGLQEKVTNTEGKLVSQDGELKNLRNKVSDLETRLAAERKQQKSAGNELDELLQSKAITIEELNTKVSTLTNKLNRKENELKENKEQTEQLEKKLEQVTEELKLLKSQMAAAKISESELRDDTEETKQELSQLQEKVSIMTKELGEKKKTELEMQEKLGEAENKINSLQVSLEMAEENGEELMEVRGTVEDLKTQLEKTQAKLVEAESRKVIQETVEKSEDASDSDSVEKLKKKIREMEAEVSEAQYGAQMNSRTLRREKVQVEKRLKETEEELNEVQTNMMKLQSSLASEKVNKKTAREEESEEDEEGEDDVSEIKKKLEEQTKKATRLEGIVQDLEDCLKSSKSSQQAVEDTVETYRQKCRALEKELGQREDRLQSMEGRLSELEVRKMDVEQKREEIERLNDSVCELEHKCKEYRSGMETLEARLSYIGMLEEKNESILSELDAHDRKVQDLNQMIEEAEKRISVLEKEVSEANTRLSQEEEARKELEKSLSEYKTSNSELETKVNGITAEIKEITTSLEEKTKELDDIRKEKDEAESQLKTKLEHSEESYTESQEKIAELQKLVEEKATSLLDIEKYQTESESKDKECQEKQSVILDLTSQIEKQKEEMKEKDTAFEAKVSELSSLEKELEEKKSDLEKTKTELEGLEAERTRVTGLLTSHESSVQSFKEQVASLKQETHSLLRKVEKLSTDKEESKVTIQSLRLEVDVKDKKISELEESVKRAKESVTSVEDLEKAHKREKELRKQLSEASSRQEEQNVKFNALEDRLREAQGAAEKQEDTKRENRETISKLKEDLRQLRSDLSASKEEREALQRQLTAEKAALESKVNTMEEEIERKEGKLKSRSSTITELMSKIEVERSSYEISLQDARANEAVLGQLKKALEDQDATIELQEKALGQKEEEIAAAQKDHAEMVEKYNALMKDTSSQSASVRDFTKQLAKLREEKKAAEKLATEAEEGMKSAKAAVGRSDKEKAQFKRDLEDTNNELREMEKILSEARREVDQLKGRLSEMKGPHHKAAQSDQSHDEEKMALLRTKFIALESTNAQLESKLDALKKELVLAEEKKKEELDRWREDRDKLVSQLEKILKQKEAQIAEMKKAAGSHPKTDHELQNRIDVLEAQISDKDAIIDELSRHLDSGDGQKGRGRRKTRHTAHGSDDSAPELRKEVEDMRKQFEAERQTHSREVSRVVKAKDQIINELRNTNLQLQSRLPGGPMRQPVASTPVVEVKVEEPSPPENTDPELSPRKAPPRRSTRRGRPRKRKSIEPETPSSEKASRSAKRKSTRTQSAMMQVSFDENHGVMPIQEEADMVELAGLLVSTPAKRVALTDTLNTSSAPFVSPAVSVKSEAPMSERSKRRVKLRGTVPEPFAESPPATPTPTPVKDNSHEIVTRQLRTRRKCTNI